MTVIDLHGVAGGVVVYLNHDARHLASIPDNSVDVIYTSPPFYGQRSYGTEGDHMGSEIGMEVRPQDFLNEMWAVTRELWRILKPTGSLFVNFGDKRAGCVDEATEAFTKNGWRSVDELSAGDSILTLNETTHMAEWGTVEAVNIFPDEVRALYVCDRRGHSSVTTADHRWLSFVRPRSDRPHLPGRWRWKTSASLAGQDAIPIAARISNLPSQPTIPDAMVELVAWHYTEGHDRKMRGGLLGGIIIGQSEIANPSKVDRIDQCLRRLWPQNLPAGNGSRWRTPEATWSRALVNDDGLVHFRLNVTAAREVRRWTGDTKLPSMEFLMLLTQEQLDLFVEVSLIADGHSRRNESTFGQVRLDHAEAFFNACILSGRAASISTEARTLTSNDGYTRQPRWTVAIHSSKSVTVYKGMHVEQRAGRVWCPTTNNGTWLARRSGNVYFTGNSGSPGTTKGRIGGASTQGARTGIEGSYPKEWFGRRKGKQMLPHRYVIGCMDGLADPDGIGWIVRQDDVWAKTSSVPEPVEDRTRDAHEYVFHLTKTGRPFCDMAVLRAPHPTIEGALGGRPISWRAVAPRPFKVPSEVLAELDAEAHTAAFPVELILPAIVGYSPSAICTVCGEGRRSLIDRQPGARERDEPIDRIVGQVCACAPLHDGVGSGRKPFTSVYNIDGWTPPPTRPAVVFDPFSGTGTVPGTAAALGRIGVYNDISASYQRVARWRISNTRIIDDSDLPAATAHLTLAADDVLIAGPVAIEPSEQLALL